MKKHRDSFSIACIGDSLSTGFELGRALPSVVSARLNTNNGWFNSGVPEERSLASILSEHYDVTTENFSTVSAHAASRATGNLSNLLLGTKNLAAQVHQVLSRREPYDVVLIWIGHNDLNFASPAGRSIDEVVSETSEAILNAAIAIEKAYQSLNRRTCVVVFGLIGFQSFFNARDEAMQIRNDDPRSYPCFDMCYEAFPTMAAGVRWKMIEAGLKINAILKTQIEKIDFLGNSTVYYSNAFQNLCISRAEFLSDKDAWHPGPLGRTTLASAAYPIAIKAIRWVADANDE